MVSIRTLLDPNLDEEQRRKAMIREIHDRGHVSKILKSIQEATTTKISQRPFYDGRELPVHGPLDPKWIREEYDRHMEETPPLHMTYEKFERFLYHSSYYQVPHWIPSPIGNNFIIEPGDTLSLALDKWDLQVTNLVKQFKRGWSEKFDPETPFHVERYTVLPERIPCDCGATLAEMRKSFYLPNYGEFGWMHICMNCEMEVYFIMHGIIN